MRVFIPNIKFLFSFAAQVNGTTPPPSYTIACKYSKYLSVMHAALSSNLFVSHAHFFNY
jgi:hypothetical protein